MSVILFRAFLGTALLVDNVQDSIVMHNNPYCSVVDLFCNVLVTNAARLMYSPVASYWFRCGPD